MADRKAALRRQMLAERDGLDPAWVRSASTAIVAALSALPQVQAAWRVALFMAIRNEPDLTDLLEILWARGAATLLPRCNSAPGSMCLAAAKDFTVIRRGRHGVPEPDPERCPAADLAGDAGCRPQVILIPGMAFGRDGSRLGFGGGYYDRLLAGPELEGGLRVGVGWDFALVDSLPVEPWDMRVHAVCTEKGVTWSV